MFSDCRLKSKQHNKQPYTFYRYKYLFENLYATGNYICMPYALFEFTISPHRNRVEHLYCSGYSYPTNASVVAPPQFHPCLRPSLLNIPLRDCAHLLLASSWAELIKVRQSRHLPLTTENHHRIQAFLHHKTCRLWWLTGFDLYHKHLSVSKRCSEDYATDAQWAPRDSRLTNNYSLPISDFSHDTTSFFAK